MSLALLLSALAQFSAASVGSGAGAGLNMPTLDRAPNAQNPRHHNALNGVPLPETSHLNQCLSDAERDPAAALITAQHWLVDTHGASRAEPQMCIGVAYGNQGVWDKAGDAFAQGRELAAPSDKQLRTRLAAMAGNAAMAQGDGARALGLLDTAHAEALAQGDIALTGGIAIDRARALVALNRAAEAADALAEARKDLPDEAQGWLLSATLARRQGQLAQAQTQIETAARLAPHDAQIGLEAGVIAMLAGHEDAARKSWQSVVASAQDADADHPAENAAAIAQARAYLDQIGQAAPAPTR